MKKILYIIDTFQTGGAEKSLLDISIHNNKIVPYFITIYKGNQLAILAEQFGIKVFQLNINDKYGFHKAVVLIRPIIDEIQPDVIHSTLFRSDIIARKLKKYYKIPLVNSLVNNSYNNDRYRNLSLLGKFKLFGIQVYDSITANNVDLFISNSDTIKETNSYKLRIKPSKIKVIYRGRNFEQFQAVSKDKIIKLKNELGICDGNKILLNVSRLLERKGQLDLLYAFFTISKINESVRLLIAGEGDYRDELENTISSLNLEDKVQLLGNRNDISQLLHLADIFVFPSHYEGLPGALIEAMMAEKIIICSDIPENKECVSNQEAVFFRKNDIKDLESKILSVLNSPNDFKIKGKAAKNIALEKFSIERIVDQYNMIYNDLINSFRK